MIYVYSLCSRNVPGTFSEHSGNRFNLEKLSETLFRTYSEKQNWNIPHCFVLTHSVPSTLSSAVKSFFARIMPKLMFTQMTVINGSIQYTVEYLVRAAEWINNLLETSGSGKMTLVPFQFDLCIAVGEPKQCDDMVDSTEADDPDGDDDDDDDDDADANADDDTDQKFEDYIGDIGAKLENNKLKNVKKEIAAKMGMGRFFDDLYKQFLDENKIKEQDQNRFSYLHSKRLVSMVDRRKQQKELNPELKDDVFMYEPPADCGSVPKAAVPEWFVSSSRQCLLPGLDVCSRYIPGTVSDHFGQIP